MRLAILMALLIAALFVSAQDKSPADQRKTQDSAATPAGVLSVPNAGIPKVEAGVAEGLLIHRVQPAYPPLAREARIQGAVVMQALINKNGAIENLHLLEGHPMLAPAALQAVKQWKYKPYLLKGTPIAVQTTITVNFVLVPDGQLKLPSIPASAIKGHFVAAALLTQVQPEYPAEARSKRLSGKVVLRISIDEKGSVKAKPIGGDKVFFKSAISAVERWNYAPATLEGKPVRVQQVLTLTFNPPAD